MKYFKGTRVDLLHYLPKHSVCAEVGVQWGRYAADVMTIVAPAKMTLIDPWCHQTMRYEAPNNVCDTEQQARYERVLEKFASAIASGQVEVHRAFSADVLPTLPDHCLDWMHIDGNHSYEALSLDLNEARRIVKPDGLILCHDYYIGLESETFFGVIPAVISFLNQHDEYELLLVTTDSPPQAVIAPRGYGYDWVAERI